MSVRFELDDAEALVLFEWLSREDEAIPVANHAERLVLWLIEAQLEKQLVEPFRPNYLELLAAARAKVESEH